jgi:hypothetical protein
MSISNTVCRKTTTADERQVHTRDRHTYVSAGAYNTRVVKRATNKRMRREARAELRDLRND